MYTEKERAELLNKITGVLRDMPEVEGLLLIGSCAQGFQDIYSDIDLMAGCFAPSGVRVVQKKLLRVFRELDAVYVDERAWTSTALGLSVYFVNGLSADISFLPTEELRLRSDRWRIAFSKSEWFRTVVEKEAQSLQTHTTGQGIDNTIYHRLIYALRRVEIAICRDQYIYADLALTEARQLLLSMEVVREGERLHHFKAYNDLSGEFLTQLTQTYPTGRNKEELCKAKEALLRLYLKTVAGCDLLGFDQRQLCLLGHFC